jgi:DNA helicase-2/ATP-dependent DNA helicase PcrA
VHERWGEGVVLSVSGAGPDAEATVAFGDVGEKRLLLAYAPLRKVG